jgi:hypothetical protein
MMKAVFSMLVPVIAIACSQNEAEHLDQRSGKVHLEASPIKADEIQTADAVAPGNPTEDEQQLALAVLPGTAFTACGIQLNSILPANTPVPCLGLGNKFLNNNLVDGDPLSKVIAHRCVQRAAEWAAYCGSPRTTSVFYGYRNGVYYPIMSSVTPGAVVGGIFDRFANKFIYEVRD